ncbi:MAG: cupin domain-containing protein [Myxococcales bacterium]|nr:cupin domain-containing protein [Myxococcales bacterium]
MSQRLFLVLAWGLLACGSVPAEGDVARRSADSDGTVSFREIDPAIWSDSAANRSSDPYQEMVQRLRDRKARDLADASAPQPFAGPDSIAKEFRAPAAPWDALGDALPLEWDSLRAKSPERVAALERAVRVRTVLRHPDFRITELAMGPGATLPAHALADPSVFHVVGGSAEFEVGAERIEAFVGASIKVEPYEARSVHVTSEAPLRALWFRWAPGGDVTYLSFGYYLTGANFHIQPREATFPADYEHWDDAERPAPRVLPGVEARPRTASPRPAELYPATPRVSDERQSPWLDFTKLADAGFFWAKDAQAGGDLLVRWNEIARMKGVFRAARPAGSYDFNLSYIAIGPRGKYVTHSHATPEFYYVLEGETEWTLDGETSIARPGHVYFHAPYWDHEMRGLVAGVPMRAITGSWAPFGDRRVWTEPALLLELLPEQPSGAELPEAFDFHRFETRELSFEAE